MISSLIFTLLVGIVAALIVKRMKKVRLLEQIPGPPALPILGNAIDFSGSHVEVFNTFKRYCKYGDGIMRFYLGLHPYCILYKAHTVEAMLSSNTLLDKSADYEYLHPWLGTGLLTSTGSKWRSRRKLLTPAFHFKILEEFVDVFNSQSERLLQKLDAHVGGPEFNIFPYSTLCTLDIIMETAMGTDVNLQRNSESDYVKAISGISKLVHTRQSSLWLQHDLPFKLLGYEKQQRQFLDILHDTSMSTIRKRRREYREKRLALAEENTGEEILGIKKRLAFLDLLLEASENSAVPLSDEDLREEVDTFMFEGHDTTAAAVAHTLYLLGRHPEIQDRLYEELLDVVGSEGNIEIEQLRDLKLLDCCIKEALRLLPSVPFMGRKIKEDTTIGRYTIPEGTTLMVFTYALHRDPAHFPDPEKFDPDRFLPNSSTGRHPYAYVPFSAGPRNCIGQKFAIMEEKIIIGNVLRKFRVTCKQEVDQLNLMGELILRPEHGISITVDRRDRTLISAKQT